MMAVGLLCPVDADAYDAYTALARESAHRRMIDPSRIKWYAFARGVGSAAERAAPPRT
jgi:hypothetical protein